MMGQRWSYASQMQEVAKKSKGSAQGGERSGFWESEWNWKVMALSLPFGVPAWFSYSPPSASISLTGIGR